MRHTTGSGRRGCRAIGLALRMPTSPRSLTPHLPAHGTSFFLPVSTRAECSPMRRLKQVGTFRSTHAHRRLLRCVFVLPRTARRPDHIASKITRSSIQPCCSCESRFSASRAALWGYSVSSEHFGAAAQRNEAGSAHATSSIARSADSQREVRSDEDYSCASCRSRSMGECYSPFHSSTAD
jgi:hypothetical protein